jgi:lysophospholipase L1-like esterase
MKKTFYLVLLSSFLFQAAFCQTATHYKWWNPANNSFPVVQGQGWHKGLAHRYDRLPAKAEKTVRKVVWSLSNESAGLWISFRSNAADIRVRYTVGGRLNMPHMPSTGVSGVDLYALNKDGGWQWSGGKYHFGDTIEYHFQSLKHDYIREYHLYLPLYNNVKWLEIGVPDSSKMTPLPIETVKPIVVYGTSIAQGACASRPGMAWTAILGRRLHRPVINLGFSGNGRLEEPVADLLTELDPEIYVIDCLPNMTGFPGDTTKARLIKTVKTLRERKPDIPVLIVQDADANINSLDTHRDSGYKRVNEVGQSAFAEMKAAGIRDIYFLSSRDIGFGIESTVEGTHPNDYGMEQYAAAYAKKIREILHEPAGDYTTTQPCMQYRSQVYDWEARHRKELEMNKTHPPRIVFLGNSITHYWGGEPYCRIHRGEDSWKKYFEPLGVRNFGFSWDRIENVLWRVYHGELDGYRARQVIMNIGTNNLAYNSDSEIVAGIKLLIGAIKQRQPGASILIIGIYPRKGGEKRVADLNQKIVHLCGNENVDYANPGVGLLDKSGKVVTSLFADGRLHPNAAGYRILAKALQPYLITK